MNMSTSMDMESAVTAIILEPLEHTVTNSKTM